MAAKRTSWMLGIAVASVVVLLAGLGVVLHLPSTLSQLRDVATDLANDSLRGQLHIGELSGSPFGELVIRGVSLTTAGGERIVAVDSATAKISWSDLLGRGVTVDAELTGVQAFFRRDSDGVLNLDTALSAPNDEPSSLLPVWLDLRLGVRDGTVVWRDEMAEDADDALAEIGPTTAPADVRDLLAALVQATSLPRRLPRTAVLDGVDTQVRVIVSQDQAIAVRLRDTTMRLAAGPFTRPRSVTLGETIVVVAADGEVKTEVASVAIDDWLNAEGLVITVPVDVAALSATIGQVHLTTSFLTFALPEAELQTDLRIRGVFGPAPEADRGSVFDARLTAGSFEPIDIAGRVTGWLTPGPDTTWQASLLVPSMPISEISTAAVPVQRAAAALEVEGQGIDPEQLRATARVAVRALDVDRYRIEAAYVHASVDEGQMTIHDSVIQTPYASAAARGRASLDGDFDLNARAKATDDVQKLAAVLFKRKVNTRADVRIEAQGRVDLGRDDPVQILRELTANIIWDVNEFVAEDVRVVRSEGNLRAKVHTVDSRTALHVSGRASGKGIKSEALSLRSLSADIRADSSVSTAEPTTMGILNQLKARVDVDIRGLDSSGALVRDVDVLLDVSPSGNKVKYDLKASAARIAVGDLRVADAATKLRGTLSLGDSLAWPGALRALAAKGSVSTHGVVMDGNAVTALDATIDIAGPVENLRGRVHATTSDLAVGEYAFTSLSADVNFIGDRLFEVTATGAQKDRKPEQLGVYVKGRHNRALNDFEVIELRFSSTGESWNLSEGFSIDTKRGTVRFDDVTLTHLDQRVHVQGHFRQGVDQDLKAEIADLDLGTLAEQFGLPALAPLRGKLNGEAELAGTSDEPTARFNVHLTGLYWHEYGPFDVRAEGRYGELALVVERFEVDGYDLRLLEGNATLPVRVTATGDFEVLQGQRIEASLATPKFNPQNLHAAVPLLSEWAVLGVVSMTTRLGGTIIQPTLVTEVRTEKLTAAAVVDKDRIEIGPIASTLGVRYHDPGKENGGFEVSFNAAWGDQPPIQLLARVQADVALWLRENLDGKEVDWTERLRDAPFRFVGQAQRFDLRNVRIGSLRKADVAGFATVSIIGSGSLAAPRANVELKLAEFGWNRYRDVFFDANLAIETDRLVLKSSRLEWDADEILIASGTIPAPFETLFGDAPLGNMPVDFKVELRPLKLAKLSAIDYAFASLKGTTQGFVSFTGTLKQPVLETHLEMDGVEFADRSTGGVTLDASLSAQDRLDGRVLWTRQGKPTLEATLNAPLDVDVLRLAAGEPLDTSGDFEATFKAKDAPLAALIPRRIFDDVVRDIKGKLTTNVSVTGNLAKPIFDGDVRIVGGGLTISEFSRTFSDIQVELSAEPGRRVVLKDMHVAGERGTIVAEGALSLDGWRPGAVDGKVEVREFGTGGFSDQTMFAWADIALDGDFSTVPASAKATVTNLEVVMPDAGDLSTLPTGLDADIVIIRTEADRAKLYAVRGTVEPVSTVPYLQLGIVIEPGARIRHPLAQVELIGELTLDLSDAGPTIRGEVQTQRGTAQFLGKKFVVQQALVTFTGSDPPDPRLQIEAVHALDRNLTRAIGQATSGEPRAIVRITGRATEPRIRFLSDPAMSESDVIYVLLTNRPPGQGEVGDAGLATGAASGLLTGIIADSPVGKIFDVRVEAGEQGFSDASIEVGRYITRDVFISVDIKGGAQPTENSSELNIEYRFLPRWIFEFEAGNRGTGEANIFWDIY